MNNRPTKRQLRDAAAARNSYLAGLVEKATQQHHQSAPTPQRSSAPDPDDAIAAALHKSDRAALFDVMVDSVFSDKVYDRTSINRRHRRSPVARTDEELALPLHAKPVGALDLSRVLQLIDREAAARLERLLLSTSLTAPGPCRLRAPRADALELERAGYCEPFGGLDTCSAVDYFSVVEAHKHRRRPIFWPRSLLERSKYVSDFTLHSVDDYRRSVLLGSHACAYDLAASFAQVALPASSNLVFHDAAGKAWRLRRLPYGIDVAPEIMQIIVVGLAGEAKRRTDASVHLFVHIDNVMAVGEADDVQRWQRAFVAVCAEASVTLNDEPTNEVQTSTSFCGLELDFSSKCVALRDSFVSRLQIPTEHTTNQDLESIVSRLVYGWAATGRDWLQLYLTIKWFRRRLSALARNVERWDAECRAPPFACRRLGDAIGTLQRNESVPVAVKHVGVAEAILATDATLTGWGAVLLRPGHMPDAVGGVFGSARDANGATRQQKPANIGVAESLAVVGGLERFAAELRQARTFTLLIDNTSSQCTISAVNEGRLPSGTAATSVIAVDIVERVRSIGAAMTVARVSTGDNIADEVSRGRPIDLNKVELNIQAAGLKFKVRGRAVGWTEPAEG